MNHPSNQALQTVREAITWAIDEAREDHVSVGNSNRQIAERLTAVLPGLDRLAEEVGRMREAVEPTDEMIRAGVDFALKVKLGGDYRWPDYMRDLWHVMDRIRASAEEPPVPPVADGWRSPSGYLIMPKGLTEENWRLSWDPSEYPDEEDTVPLFEADALPPAPEARHGE